MKKMRKFTISGLHGGMQVLNKSTSTSILYATYAANSTLPLVDCSLDCNEKLKKIVPDG